LELIAVPARTEAYDPMLPSAGLGTDADMMARLVRGDEPALRQIAQRHGGRVLRIAQRMLGSAAEADEVMQETLIRVWQSAARWDPQRASLGTWIGTIAWRLCADRLRQPGRRIQLDLQEAETVASLDDDAEAQLIRRQTLSQVQTALDRLPARQRAAFVLFHVDEVSGQDAARMLGVGLRAFWSLLQRARHAVEKEMHGKAVASDKHGNAVTDERHGSAVTDERHGTAVRGETT
jgi:RNA polymerase sigma-70 factor (ECF subfamily)